MCGLAGYCGIKSDENTKLALVTSLAKGIDARGGDAAGYVSVSESGLRYSRKLGKFEAAKLRFLRGAAKGDICMMHARFATCGKGGVDEAHPYAIHRNGRVVMWGAHNGMVPGAYASAKSNGREISVDSQEIFELLADQNYEGIRKLSGYGVITWIDALKPDHVNVARLSKDSDFYIMPLDEGGVAWASTEKILREALGVAGLHSNQYYNLHEIGRVYSINLDGNVQETNIDGIKVAERGWSGGGSFRNYWGSDFRYGWGSDRYSGYNTKSNSESNAESSLSEQEMEAFWNRAMAEAEQEEIKSESVPTPTPTVSLENKEGFPYEVWTLDEGIVASFLSEDQADQYCHELIEKGKTAEVYFMPPDLTV